MPDSSTLPQQGVNVSVRLYQSADEAAWESFVLAHPHGTAFHRLAWSLAVQDAYGHAPCHLTAWRGERLSGVLPLFLVRSVLAGRVMVSVPYATYGGILADGPAEAAVLLETAKGLCRENRAEHMELRHRESSGLDLPAIDRYETYRKPLPETVEGVLPFLPKKARAAARTAFRKLGEDCVRSGPEWLEAVYDLHCLTMWRLGSPNHARSFFRALGRNFGNDCVCAVVRNTAGAAIAGVLALAFRDELVAYYCGSTEEGMASGGTNALYARLMELAVARGLRIMDFNRTRKDNPGPAAFKRHLGFEASPLHYQVYLANARELPNLTPSNRRFALAGAVWSKLPLWLTRPMGSRVSRWIP
jgi:FemAB-related protein (PEP-CTERM system-associated)